MQEHALYIEAPGLFHHDIRLGLEALLDRLYRRVAQTGNIRKPCLFDGRNVVGIVVGREGLREESEA